MACSAARSIASAWLHFQAAASVLNWARVVSEIRDRRVLRPASGRPAPGARLRGAPFLVSS